VIEVKHTGYFGIPGGTGKLVHAVDHRQKPICGQRLHPKAEFQWCCHGLDYQMTECEKCKRILRCLLAWKQTGTDRFERHDGAVVTYGRRHWGPETDENSPGHRGWVGFGPGAQKTNYIGYYPRRWRSGGHSNMRVPVKYKTAEGAMRAVDKKFPWQTT
jgi:hypothetical protein